MLLSHKTSIKISQEYSNIIGRAFNILRKYLSVSGKQKELSVTGLKNPEIIKVAV